MQAASRPALWALVIRAAPGAFLDARPERTAGNREKKGLRAYRRALHTSTIGSACERLLRIPLPLRTPVNASLRKGCLKARRSAGAGWRSFGVSPKGLGLDRLKR